MRHQKNWFAFALILLLGINLGFSQAFTDSLEIPPLFDSRSDTLYVDIETHDFGSPGLHNIETLAYNHESSGTNSYLGPTLTWIVGDTQTTHLVNRMPVIDGRGNITTVHWHGANIPAWTDGGPHQFFGPGETFTPKFKVLDRPTTLWYHPHAEDVTYTQVQMGLAGLILVKDPSDPVAAILPNTYGHDDIPLIIQDIYFDEDSSSGTFSVDTTRGPFGSAGERILVVNGTIQPYLKVLPQPTTFRILDGSTRNAYRLGFVSNQEDTVVSSRIPFAIFGSDGGYLPDSVRFRRTLETGTGVRNGIIFDFSAYAGDTLYFKNFPGDFRSEPGTVIGSDLGPNSKFNNTLIQIIVENSPKAPIGAIPSSLPAIAPPPPPSFTRVIKLTGQGQPGTAAEKFGIDSSQYDFNTINAVVKQDSTEDWVIENHTNVAHPFHQHLVQFFVQKVETLNGDPLPMPVEYLGPKDDILVKAGQKVTYRVTFDSYAQPKPFNLDSSAYMYHCHILTHEDGYYGGSASTIAGRSSWGMMQQFAVWDGTSTSLENPIDNNMLFYPNPAGDQIFLNGESPKMSKVRISDIQGRILMEKVLPPFMGTTSVDVSQLSRGLILMEWISPDSRQIKKIILE